MVDSGLAVFRDSTLGFSVLGIVFLLSWFRVSDF